MPDRPVFVDTNVLVYLRDQQDPERQRKAAEWMGHLWESRLGRLSTQVLHEYYVTVTAELKPGLPTAEAQEDALALTAPSPLPLTASLMEDAWDAQEQWDLSFWDSLIVAAARALGAEHS